MFQLPPWLDGEDARPYYVRLCQATPQWLTREQKRQFYRIYARMRRMRRSGRRVSVDHIVPLKNELVCGLNVPWNLEIIDESSNYSKGNRSWPDAPYEVIQMFGAYEPQQLRLI